MLYSGMPIAEQSRYTGEKYLPALAQLESQQNQQKFSLTSALNDLNMKKYSQAQAVRQQELDREEQARQAEAQRQAALQAARLQASRSYGGGGGGGAAPAAAAKSKDNIGQAILRAVGSGAAWGDIARDLDGTFGGGTAQRYDLLLKQSIGAREGDPMKYMR